MLRKAGLLCAALAMFSIAGGHWAVLQTAAWGQMLADYARETGSVVTAVGQTFDGEHPCDLCRQIAAAKGQEKSSPQTADQNSKILKGTKGDGVLPEHGFALGARFAVLACWHASAQAAPCFLAECPPVPPPRPAVIA